MAFSLHHPLEPKPPSLCGAICGEGPPFPHNPLNVFAKWRKRLTSASADVGARPILCAGIIVLDEVFRVDRFPQPDAKTQAQSFFVVNGGCAANAAVAIARLGGRAVLAGPLGGPPGEDSNGDRVLAALAREQVDCSGCQRIAGAPTALSAIFLDAHGDRMIVTYGDDRLAAATPSNPAHLVASADVVLADNRFPEFVRPICGAARAGSPSCSTPTGRPRCPTIYSGSPRTWCSRASACAPPRGSTISSPRCGRNRPHDAVVSRRHPWAARRALAWGRIAAQDPGVPGQ